jgi:hypothetical protein
MGTGKRGSRERIMKIVRKGAAERRKARNEKLWREESMRNAAPQLYEACKVALQAMCGWDSFQRTCNLIDRAVRKAEGKA